MTQSEMIIQLLNLQTSLTDALFHILGVIHLRVAVRHRREVKARHRETEGGGIKPLTVP